MTPSAVQGTKVLIVTPVLLLGGTEMQMLSMVRILAANGYRVSVCCAYEHDERIVDEFRAAGSETELLNLNRSGGRMNLREMFTLFRMLAVKFRSHRNAIVHVQYVAPGLVPLLAAKVSGVRTILATIHYPRHALGLMELLYVRVAERLCDLFICNSAATERSWFGTSRVFDSSMKGDVAHCTIYNGVDQKRIMHLSSKVDKNAAKTELGIAGEKIIGVVGRLRAEKGHEFLFHAMANVLRSMSPVKLLIVGDGPDKPRLQTLAADLGVDKAIVWGGAKTQEETFALVRNHGCRCRPLAIRGIRSDSCRSNGGGCSGCCLRCRRTARRRR